MATEDILIGVDLALKNGCQIDLAGEKSLDLIKKAEITLELKFPPSYKEFLHAFGCGDIAGHEFYGITDFDFTNSGIPDAVWITVRERIDSNLPRQFLIIGEQGNGAYYVLNCECEGAECPVILWWPGLSLADQIKDAEILAQDFGSFFVELIKNSL